MKYQKEFLQTMINGCHMPYEYFQPIKTHIFYLLKGKIYVPLIDCLTFLYWHQTCEIVDCQFYNSCSPNKCFECSTYFCRAECCFLFHWISVIEALELAVNWVESNVLRFLRFSFVRKEFSFEKIPHLLSQNLWLKCKLRVAIILYKSRKNAKKDSS